MDEKRDAIIARIRSQRQSSHLLCPICRYKDNLDKINAALTKIFCEFLYRHDQKKDDDDLPDGWKEEAHALYSNDEKFYREVELLVQETLALM